MGFIQRPHPLLLSFFFPLRELVLCLLLLVWICTVALLFVTSSDDKSLRVREFGIPVVIKYISEPHMHSMPSISLHLNSNWLAAQSMDNQIVIYSTREKFQLNKKKRFAGHIVAGYACQVNFSPDGRFVFSGDGEGRCWFWDWKTCKVFKTLRFHDGVCIGASWHPLEQSKFATCGWGGLIKYWPCKY